MSIIATINPKAAAMAALACAVKDVRYYLQGVYIEPREAGGVTVTATNGHILVTVADPEGSCAGPCIVQLDRATVTACKHKKAITLIIDGDDKTAAVEGTKHFTRCKLIDAKYPDWRAIVPATLPEPVPTAPPTVAAEYLGLLAQVARIMAGQFAGVRLHYIDTNSRVCVTFTHTLNLNIRAVVMPRRTDSDAVWLA